MSNIETSVDAVGDLVSSSHLLDVDQQSPNESKNQMVQKMPFKTFALIFWVVSIVCFISCYGDGWKGVKEEFDDGKSAGDAAVSALILVCLPCFGIFSCKDGHPKSARFVGLCIVVTTVLLFFAKPMYNKVYGGSVFTDPA
eukprot:290921_1